MRAASLADLPEEGAIRVELAGKPVCLARSGGQVYALSEGDVEAGQIECWLHGSMFDLATGAPTGLPAVKPVPTYPVTIEGDDVLVQMET